MPWTVQLMRASLPLTVRRVCVPGVRSNETCLQLSQRCSQSCGLRAGCQRWCSLYASRFCVGLQLIYWAAVVLTCPVLTYIHDGIGPLRPHTTCSCALTAMRLSMQALPAQLTLSGPRTPVSRRTCSPCSRGSRRRTSRSFGRIRSSSSATADTCFRSAWMRAIKFVACQSARGPSASCTGVLPSLILSVLAETERNRAASIMATIRTCSPRRRLDSHPWRHLHWES